MKRLVGGLALTLAALCCSGSDAEATTSGPCTAVVNGVDLSTVSADDPDDAIEVAADGTLDAVVTSSQSIGRYEVELTFLGIPWTVAEDDANGTSWSRSIDVTDYARFGVGLYRVDVTSGGSAPCSGSLLVEITGSPFGAVAGWFGLAAAAGGAGVVAFAATQGRRPLPKSSSVLGPLGGLGAVLLVQQFGLATPSAATTTVALIVGGALPFAAQQVGGLVMKGRP